MATLKRWNGTTWDPVGSDTYATYRNTDGTPTAGRRPVILLDEFGEPDDIISEEI